MVDDDIPAHWKNFEPPEDWPGPPISTAAVVRGENGRLTAWVNGEPVDPSTVPDLVAALEEPDKTRDA